MRDRGFTSTELVVTIVIAMILMAVAVPILREQLAAIELNGAARRVAGDLYRTRMRAVAENTRYRIAYTGSQYQLEKDVNGTFEEHGPVIAMPTGVTLAIQPDPNVTFRPSGWVDTNAPVSISVANTFGSSKVVTVTFGGRVSVTGATS